MKLLVVFFAFAAVACASIVPLAQPAYHSALVLDPHGRPLDTAEVINARAIHLQAKALEPHIAPLVAHAAIAPVAHAIAPAVVAAPAAVSHQSRVDVRTSPAIVTAHASPVLAAHGAYAPLLGHSALGLAGHGHLLKKRSLGHYAYAAPIIAPAAVSHQSRVDVVSSPAILSHAIATPVIAHHAVAPVVAHAYAPAAVSHQSRVDVRTSPAVVSHSVVSAPILSAHSSLGLSGHGHLLKKRSLGYVAAPIAIAHAPAALSHQSRVDVHTSPAVVSHSVVAAPILGAHSSLALYGHGHLLKKRSLGYVAAPIAIAHAPAALSHQSRVDVISSPAIVAHAAIAPLAHSAVWTAPVSHLLHSAPLAHAAHW